MGYQLEVSIRMKNESRKSEEKSRKSIRLKKPNPNLIRIRLGFGLGEENVNKIIFLSDRLYCISVCSNVFEYL